MTTQTLSLNLLRRLALMQHLGEDYFIIDEVAYEGSEEEKKQEYSDYSILFTEDKDNEGEEPLTFAEWAEDECTAIEELEEDDYSIDYMVLTDEEADDKWEESLDNYIAECITPELDKLDTLGNLSYYIKFDEEMWKRDARMDGRGHSLSTYDGNEDEETVNEQTFYIYRTN